MAKYASIGAVQLLRVLTWLPVSGIFLMIALLFGSIAFREFQGEMSSAFPAIILAIITMFFATGSAMAFRNATGHLTRKQYYSISGTKKKKRKKHVCLFCGKVSDVGYGIYTHGEYKSPWTFHECTGCQKVLFADSPTDADHFWGATVKAAIMIVVVIAILLFAEKAADNAERDVRAKQQQRRE